MNIDGGVFVKVVKMHGEAERLGLNDVDDVTKMIKDMRKEL